MSKEDMPQGQPVSEKKQANKQRGELTEAQFCVLREHATERAGSSPLNAEKRVGTYYCAGCDSALFSSQAKYESHSGWPSFFQPVESAVEEDVDYKLGYARVEIHCAECKGHLGHVFEDGPPPTGLRYCINGLALNFKAANGVGND